MIAYTTDLTGDDAAAFVHACALAAASESRLVTVHDDALAATEIQLPDASVISARWGKPIAHDRMCHECCDDVTDTVIDAIRRIGPQLVVAGTHARHGISALLHASVGEAIARNVGVPTLIVQNHGRGFVDAATGAFRLHRVLVPAGTRAEALAGLTAARALLGLARRTEVELVVVHASANGDDFDLSDLPVTVSQTRGKLENVVVAAASEQSAGLIVMVSRGHDGVIDALRGSHTEHVIRDAGCPVLSVPL
ncbi:MAG: universal stress protein [Kofleriaceae bacterium]